MASACSILYEEQVLCSICLGEFKEPVSTPCGHNFCKDCITLYWNSQDNAQCPLCKRKLGNKPKLKVNTEFRDVVEHFNRMRAQGGPKIVAQPGEVPCDVCTKPKLKAHKTCLVCLASYCEPHLESHQNLKKHKLIDPVSNLEDRVCKKHDKMLELFCRTDQQCVCMMCLNDDHTGHEAVPLERAFKERRDVYENVTSEMKKSEISKSESVKNIKCFVEKSRETTADEIREIVQILTSFVASVQKYQGELVEAIEQKQKDIEKQAEDQTTLLEQDISDVRRLRCDVEQFIQSEDYLFLLQNFPLNVTFDNTHPTDQPTDSILRMTQDIPDIGQHGHIEMVKKSVGQIEETLRNEMEMLIQKVGSSDSCDAPTQSHAVENMTANNFLPERWRQPQDELMMIQQCNAVDLTLDPYTASNWLRVSDDGKRLTVGGHQQIFSFFARPFKYLPYILAKEGFSSGRFYYEVQVSSCKRWLLGVTKEFINREIYFEPTPEDGAWILNTQNQIQTVRVFVNYEEGKVSFYDVEARSEIYTFTGCAFKETTPLRSFISSVAGISSIHRPKLYPVFGIYNNYINYYGDSLVITPVSKP
ncbi:E3 ubiquitin-protein ligase TRIM39-like [Poeciliopsis prolifica]|uniref:E3 ubiquitin-protein ligase TRIM39-like n=1 Tax=Poeciliopsis prolifica TaxID=188132 RepID=UPI00241351BE|nr:E3 ubiquitin-protein ligase TRIM39-like [Poeciliopsis prolifica]